MRRKKEKYGERTSFILNNTHRKYIEQSIKNGVYKTMADFYFEAIQEKLEMLRRENKIREIVEL